MAQPPDPPAGVRTRGMRRTGPRRSSVTWKSKHTEKGVRGWTEGSANPSGGRRGECLKELGQWQGAETEGGQSPGVGADEPAGHPSPKHTLTSPHSHIRARPQIPQIPTQPHVLTPPHTHSHPHPVTHLHTLKFPHSPHTHSQLHTLKLLPPVPTNPPSYTFSLSHVVTHTVTIVPHTHTHIRTHAGLPNTSGFPALAPHPSAKATLRLCKCHRLPALASAGQGGRGGRGAVGRALTLSSATSTPNLSALGLGRFKDRDLPSKKTPETSRPIPSTTWVSKARPTSPRPGVVLCHCSFIASFCIFDFVPPVCPTPTPGGAGLAGPGPPFFFPFSQGCLLSGLHPILQPPLGSTTGISSPLSAAETLLENS